MQGCDCIGRTRALSGGLPRATDRYGEALGISRPTGDLRGEADALARLGNMATEQGRPSESPPLYEQALRLYRQLGDDFGAADVMLRSGETALYTGDYTRAIALCEESLRFSRWAGMKYRPAYILLTEGEAAIGMGDLVRAEATVAKSRTLFQEIGDRRCVGTTLMLLADIARERGDYPRAQDLYRESLALHLELNTRPEIARCLERAARLMCIEKLDRPAAQLHGAAEALRDSMDSVIAPADKKTYEECIASARRRLGDGVFTAEAADGRAMSLPRVVGRLE